MFFCRSCGKEVGEDAAMCVNCGAILDEERYAELAKLSQAQTETTSAVSIDKRKNVSFWLMLSSLILVGLSVMLFVIGIGAMNLALNRLTALNIVGGIVGALGGEIDYTTVTTLLTTANSLTIVALSVASTSFCVILAGYIVSFSEVKSGKALPATNIKYLAFAAVSLLYTIGLIVHIVMV